MTTLPKPVADYLAFLREGRLMIQRSRSSGRHYFYPRVVEPGSGADDLEWVEASGSGTVYATTVQRSRPPSENLNVALIDLDEGPRMMSRVDGIAPEQVKIGMRVGASIVSPTDGLPYVIFRPEAEPE